MEPLHKWRTSEVLKDKEQVIVAPHAALQQSVSLSTLMPQTANRIHSPSRSLSSDDENTPPLSLDASKEALIKVSVVTIFVEHGVM